MKHKVRLKDFKIIFAIIIFIIVLKLFYIQIIDNKYRIWSMSNSVRIITLYPNRGEIYDRHGLLLAQSKEAYDVYITPRELEIQDTLKLCQILSITKDSLDKLIRNATAYSFRKASIILSQVDQLTKLQLDEQNISGLSTSYRSIRSYPFNTGGNILGYVSSVSKKDLESDEFYDMNDLIGKTGIESTYENILRGEKGQSHVLVNVHGVVQGAFKNGEMDYSAITGGSITTTIDLKLQKMAEELMVNKIGSIVAIEPQTGEILALISSPTYNPDILINRDRKNNYLSLLSDPTKPLFNRSAMALYPPGSTFKMAVGLIGLQEGVIDWNTKFYCSNGFHVKGKSLACHSHYSPLALDYAIQTSCNSFFCHTFLNTINSSKFRNIKDGFDSWKDHLTNFGFGAKLNTDIAGELNGFIPGSSYYDKIHNNRWNGLSVLSVSIGQGEILVTPIQLANFTAILANRGHYFTPHLLKKINDSENINEEFKQKHYTSIAEKHFEPITDAMWHGVNVSGTGLVAKVNGLDICGKTGTAQNGFGADHSTFVAFAPKNNPQIAICVYVENGGYGASAAAPIASLLIEQYLQDTITRTALVDKVKALTINYKQYAK